MAVSNEDMLAMARKLPIPVPWDRDVFIANIAAQRGRPIHLIPTDTAALAGSPCGLWLTREHDDLILHEIGTSEYHIDQIVCHVLHSLIDRSLSIFLRHVMPPRQVAPSSTSQHPGSDPACA